MLRYKTARRKSPIGKLEVSESTRNTFQYMYSMYFTGIGKTKLQLGERCKHITKFLHNDFNTGLNKWRLKQFRCESIDIIATLKEEMHCGIAVIYSFS